MAARSDGVTQMPSKSQHAGIKQTVPGVVHGSRTTPHPQVSRPGTLQMPGTEPIEGLADDGHPSMHLEPVPQPVAGSQLASGPGMSPASD